MESCFKTATILPEPKATLRHSQVVLEVTGSTVIGICPVGTIQEENKTLNVKIIHTFFNACILKI